MGYFDKLAKEIQQQKDPRELLESGIIGPQEYLDKYLPHSETFTWKGKQYFNTGHGVVSPVDPIAAAYVFGRIPFGSGSRVATSTSRALVPAGERALTTTSRAVVPANSRALVTTSRTATPVSRTTVPSTNRALVSANSRALTTTGRATVPASRGSMFIGPATTTIAGITIHRGLNSDNKYQLSPQNAYTQNKPFLVLEDPYGTQTESTRSTGPVRSTGPARPRYQIPEEYNTRDKIIELQKQLTSLGYNLGKYGVNGDGVDGKWGRMTDAAYRDYMSKYSEPFKFDIKEVEPVSVVDPRQTDFDKMKYIDPQIMKAKAKFSPDLANPDLANPELSFAKQGGKLYKFQDGGIGKLLNDTAKMIQERVQQQKKTQNLTDEQKLQQQLAELGLYKGKIDGIIGNGTKNAIKKAESMGYRVEGNKLVKQNFITKSSQKVVDFTKQQQQPTEHKQNFIERSGQQVTDFITQQQQPTGHAIYLHYPNFVGESKNAIKIGNTDLGEIIGNPRLPVGHAAVVLIDDNGNSDYYEYGRYTPSSGHVIGKEQRSSRKGGNWRHLALPKQKEGENDSTYVSRIQGMLPDTKYGAYQAISIPFINTQKARGYINQQADDPNRKEYGIFNTCATGACKAVLPFRTKKLNHPILSRYRAGYSDDAISWAAIPFTTDSYAAKARKASSNIYLMNESK